MARIGALIVWIALLFLGGDGATAARPVVADLSNHLVAITTGFSGTHVLVFGATDDRKGDIVMVVRGPRETHVVREKVRLAGIWVNREAAVFPAIPAFYAVAATGPLNTVVPSEIRKRHEASASNPCRSPPPTARTRRCATTTRASSARR